MATNTGKRMGEEKGIQRNKETSGPKPNRSPGESNANRVLPSFREDMDKSQPKDFERIKKGLMPSTKGGRDLAPTGRDKLLRATQQEAGGRAMLRSTGRAGSAELAFQLGYAAGRELDERTGVGKAAVNESNVGRAASEALSKSDRVKLSEESKQRLADIENDKAMREVDEEKKSKVEPDEYAKGGSVKKYAKGGMIQANCGASMKPAQSKKY